MGGAKRAVAHGAGREWMRETPDASDPGPPISLSAHPTFVGAESRAVHRQDFQPAARGQRVKLGRAPEPGGVCATQGGQAAGRGPYERCIRVARKGVGHAVTYVEVRHVRGGCYQGRGCCRAHPKGHAPFKRQIACTARRPLDCHEPVAMWSGAGAAVSAGVGRRGASSQRRSALHYTVPPSVLHAARTACVTCIYVTWQSTCTCTCEECGRQRNRREGERARASETHGDTCVNRSNAWSNTEQNTQTHTVVAASTLQIIFLLAS